jgi:hypothetical protein
MVAVARTRMRLRNEEAFFPCSTMDATINSAAAVRRRCIGRGV